MFEGDSGDKCANTFPLVSMGGQAEGLACADLGARTPIGASRNYSNSILANIFAQFGYKWEISSQVHENRVTFTS